MFPIALKAIVIKLARGMKLETGECAPKYDAVRVHFCSLIRGIVLCTTICDGFNAKPESPLYCDSDLRDIRALTAKIQLFNYFFF